LIQLRDAAKWFKAQPHQLAAWDWLQGQLSKEQLDEFAELYRAAAEQKSLPPPWLNPALKIIREFEGCKLTSYPDPGTGGAPWTIGWGSTRTKDGSVRQGMTITQQEADQLLADGVEQLFGPGVLALLPPAAKWRPNQVAAIVSFAWNVGLGALEDSTLRRRIVAGEPAETAVREELPKWCHAGEAVLAGLERRRAAEVALFCGGTPTAPSSPVLRVPYYSQRDSATDQALRMCFSSSCAMLLASLKPGAISGPNADDQYLKRVQQYGDSTDASAQIKALASYGVKAQLMQNCDWVYLERQIKAGIPVPCGYLHKGSVSKPSGGHWLCVIGLTPSHVIVNDPYGEMDVINGTYISSKGAGIAYSRKNWGPRWLVEGPASGWAIIAQP
jgi:GH24 family phage-related lysozyme (muramidase)